MRPCLSNQHLSARCRPKHNRLASLLSRSCASFVWLLISGVIGVYAASQPFTEGAKLTASDGGHGDFFGSAIAVGGDTVVVGASGKDDFTFNEGAVYVFVRPAGGFIGALRENARLIGEFVCEGATCFSSLFLGNSVAVSGDMIVAGSDGSAYVFIKPVGGWVGHRVQDATLIHPGDGSFARTVAVSGDTVIMGAAQNDVGFNRQQGEAFVFTKPALGWEGTLHEDAVLVASDGTAFDRFGTSVAVDGDTVVIGHFSLSERGAAYVFVKPAGGWVGVLRHRAEIT